MVPPSPLDQTLQLVTRIGGRPDELPAGTQMARAAASYLTLAMTLCARQANVARRMYNWHERSTANAPFKLLLPLRKKPGSKCVRQGRKRGIAARRNASAGPLFWWGPGAVGHT